MISLKCPKCGFFFSVGLPDDITAEEEKKAKMCPCGEMMVEVPFSLDNIPIMGVIDDGKSD